MRGFEIVTAFRSRSPILPKRQSASSAGYDFYAITDATIAPGGVYTAPTGIKAYMPSDEVLLLFIRSSLAIQDNLVLANGVAVIDADYYNNPTNEGHILIALRNTGTEDIFIPIGKRIAQGIFLKYLTIAGDVPGQGNYIRTGGIGSTG